MKRPNCKKCGGPLDIWHDPDTRIGFICNNPQILETNEQFQEHLTRLNDDEYRKLESHVKQT